MFWKIRQKLYLYGLIVAWKKAIDTVLAIIKIGVE